MLPVDTARLQIRPLLAEDIPALVALWTDPAVMEHLGGPRDPLRLREIFGEELAQSEPSRYTLWPVVERATGTVVGECGLLEKEVGGRAEIEIVYVFARTSWGRGYATEAAAALRDAAGRAGIRRLIALIDPLHPASAAVARRIGMRLERQVVRPDGAVRQVYALDLGQGNSPGVA